MREIQHKDSIRAKRKRMQRRRKRRRIMCSAAILCASGLMFICLKTNWFTDLPAGKGKRAQVERLKEQILDTETGYPAELAELLEQNEETYEFVKDYPNRDAYVGKEIRFDGDFKEGSVPLLMQWDKRWGYDLYGDSMIGVSGCGPTCMTMAYLYYTGDTGMNPRTMAEFAQDGGYHTEEGTSWSFWTEGAAKLGLYGEEVSLSEASMKNVLDRGGVIVCSMSPGDFTAKGHFILLRDYDENGFFVNDPNRKSNSKKQWDFESLSHQIKNLWALYKT